MPARGIGRVGAFGIFALTPGHCQDVQQSERLQALLSELDEPWPLREQALGDAGTYGELRAAGVAAMLDFFASLSPLGPDDVFVDLGSGRGRVPAQVVLQSPAHAVGIELSLSRAAAASRLQGALQRRDEESSSRLALLQGDFREMKTWSSATLVYVNSAAFPAKLLFELRAAFQQLQPGSLVLT
ncbi:DOT1, partial [Symbiodinium necroappetens]